MNNFGRMRRAALHGSAALAALCAAAVAQAQDGGAGRVADGGEEEIVVTAQKRAERLIEVPASISVLGGELLERSGVRQLTDTAAFAPGLQIDSGGTPGQTTVSLRGIAPIGASATVGAYIDDAPVGSSSIYARSAAFAADLLPYDIDRIEVLRGPQGTLYGASSIGGLLKYVTRRPDLSDFEVRAGGELSLVESSGDIGYAGRVGVNLPVVAGTLGLRGSYAYQRSPGYIDNVRTGEDDVNGVTQQSARLALLWQPDPDVSVNLGALWQSIDTDGNGVETYVIPPQYNGANTDRVPFSALEPVAGGRSATYQLPEFFTKDLLFLSGTVEWDLGFATLVSATTYSDTNTVQHGDFSEVYGIIVPLLDPSITTGYSVFEIELDLEKFTQEVRLASPGNQAFEWMIGGFYTREKSGNAQIVTAQRADGSFIDGFNPLAVAGLPSTYDEYAIFGNATYTFGNVFELSAGLRWARNVQDFRQISDSAVGLVPTADTPGTSAESVWTYSASGRLILSDRASIYARIATGYRPGGPNVIAVGAPPQVGSDSLTNYELGFKAETPARDVSVDAAIFYMDWRDIQLSTSQNGVSFAVNAGQARSLGFEISASVRPTTGLTLGVNAAFTNSQLSEDAPDIDGLDGDRLPVVPSSAVSLVGSYEFDVGGGWDGQLGGALRLVSERFSAIESDPDTVRLPGYATLDLNASISNGSWTARIFARNLTDSRGLLSGGLNTNAFNQRYNATFAPIQPRTIGLAVDVRF